MSNGPLEPSACSWSTTLEPRRIGIWRIAPSRDASRLVRAAKIVPPRAQASQSRPCGPETSATCPAPGACDREDELACRRPGTRRSRRTLGSRSYRRGRPRAAQTAPSAPRARREAPRRRASCSRSRWRRPWDEWRRRDRSPRRRSPSIPARRRPRDVRLPAHLVDDRSRTQRTAPARTQGECLRCRVDTEPVAHLTTGRPGDDRRAVPLRRSARGGDGSRHLGERCRGDRPHAGRSGREAQVCRRAVRRP